MAAQRTYDEKVDIVERCLELERAGGDVLGYLWSENYYTPRATWCNLQREFLGRKPYQYTDGKPNKKGVTYMAMTSEQKLKAAQIAIDGGDPRVYMEQECGLTAPEKTWWLLKEWIKKNHPEMAEKLPGKLKPAEEYRKVKVDKGLPKAEAPVVKVNGGLKIETPEADQVEIVEVPEKQNITKPVNFGGFEVTAIRDENLGEFYYDRKFGFIDWRTPEGEEISFTPDAWREMYRKLPEILGVLGVQV